MSERLRVREIDDEEGWRLVWIVRRWQRVGGDLAAGADGAAVGAGLDTATIAKVAFTSEDRIRNVIGTFNADRFASLYPKYRGGRRSSACRSPRSSRSLSTAGAVAFAASFCAVVVMMFPPQTDFLSVLSQEYTVVVFLQSRAR